MGIMPSLVTLHGSAEILAVGEMTMPDACSDECCWPSSSYVCGHTTLGHSFDDTGTTDQLLELPSGGDGGGLKPSPASSICADSPLRNKCVHNGMIVAL